MGISTMRWMQYRSRAGLFFAALLLVVAGIAPGQARADTVVDLLPALAPLQATDASGNGDGGTLNDYDLVQSPSGSPTAGTIWLRFTGSPANYGAGPLDVIGKRDSASPQTVDPSNDVIPAYQRIHRSDGSFYDVKIGPCDDGCDLVYHEVHHHFHFQSAAQYSLLDSAGQVIRDAPKQSFCLANVVVADSTLPGFPPGEGAFASCNHDAYATFVQEGVSVGWADVYDKSLIGQAFDVTDLMSLPPQLYTLRMTTNPLGVLREMPSPKHAEVATVQVLIGQGVPFGVGEPRPGV